MDVRMVSLGPQLSTLAAFNAAPAEAAGRDMLLKITQLRLTKLLCP